MIRWFTLRTPWPFFLPKQQCFHLISDLRELEQPIARQWSIMFIGVNFWTTMVDTHKNQQTERLFILNSEMDNFWKFNLISSDYYLGWFTKSTWENFLATSLSLIWCHLSTCKSFKKWHFYHFTQQTIQACQRQFDCPSCCWCHSPIWISTLFSLIKIK